MYQIWLVHQTYLMYQRLQNTAGALDRCHRRAQEGLATRETRGLSVTWLDCATAAPPRLSDLPISVDSPTEMRHHLGRSLQVPAPGVCRPLPWPRD